MTLSVTPTCLTEIETLLVSWSTKKSATKSELQSLVGKLSFISKCVWQSSLFLSRILALLWTLRQNGHRTRLSTEFRRDIAWWLRFMRTYKGVSIISSLVWTAPDAVFSTDACLLGCGGLTQSQYFHVQFPADVLARFSKIHLLEALAILVALCLWGHLWAGCRIQVFCDTAAVVSALTSGRVKDQRLLSRPAFCFRWFSCLVVSILPQSISPFHVPFCLPFSLWHVFLTSFLFLRDLLIVVRICVEGTSFQPPMVSLSLSSGLKLIRLVNVICFCL